MPRGSLKLILYICIAVFAVSTVCAMTSPGLTLGNAGDVLALIRVGSLVLVLIVGVWLTVTRKKPTAN
jgi:hypothetical protein